MKLRQTMCAVLLSGAAVFGFACGDDKEENESSGIECDSTLTYTKDIAPIVSSKCLSCHSKSVTGPARGGAPSDHNFDTEADVKNYLDHIEEEAVIENAMPPGGLPQSDRQKLGAWIACQ